MGSFKAVLSVASFVFILHFSEGVSPRIIGGENAKKNEFPMMVALLKKSNFNQFCGGTIISNKHVLTAGHCMFESKTAALQMDSFGVVFGAHDLLKVKTEDIVSPLKVTLHKKYKFEIHYDMCILDMPEIKFSPIVAPVCLPSTRFDFKGKALTHMGWGLTKAFKFGATKLKKTLLHVVDRSMCKETYKDTDYFDNNDDYQVCTFQTGTSQCQGDSGGPVMHKNGSGKWMLVGAISFGWPTCDKPSAISDVSYFYPWIKSHVESSGGTLASC